MKILVCCDDTSTKQIIVDLIEKRGHLAIASNVSVESVIAGRSKNIASVIGHVGVGNNLLASEVIEAMKLNVSRVSLRSQDCVMEERQQIGKFGNWPKPRTKKNKNFRK